MAEQKDRSQDYETAETVQTGPGFEVFRAKERGTGSPCFLHRMNFDKGIGDTLLQSALSIVKRYGMLHYARTPRLADAWVGDGFLAAVEFKTEARPLDLTSNNPFQTGRRESAARVMESTLALLCSLHYLGIVHGELVPNSFGIGPLGKLYLVDSGLDRSIVECFRKSNEDMFMLSTNLLGEDVARWAFAVLSLYSGGPLLDDGLDDKWDEYHFRRAKDRVGKILPREEAANFFMDALLGFGTGEPRFDSATDAMREWYSKRIWSLIE